MKLKGINPVEQHAEKIVLALVSVVFLGVLAMQFLHQPNRVKVGTALVPPDQAFAEVEKQANSIRGRITDPDVELPEVKAISIASEFEAKIKGPQVVRPGAGSVSFGAAIRFDGDTSGAGRGGAGTQVAEVRVPAPTGVVAASYMATLDPMEWIFNEGLRAHLPKEQPFDKAFTSVECVFDGIALRRALTEDPDGAGPVRPVPINWWNDKFAILALELEREERMSDGSWGNSTVVSGLPGRLEVASWVKTDSSLGVEQAAFEALRASEAHQRPEFYSLIAGSEWVPPTEIAAGEAMKGMDPAVATRIQRLRTLDRRLSDNRKALDALGSGPAQRSPGDRAPGSGRMVEGGAPANDRDARRRESLTKARDSMLRDRTRIETELANLGYTPEGQATRTEGGAAPARRVPFLEDGAVRLWAHDVTVEAGKTYRYRTRVMLNNPAFGRGASLVPEQKTMAEERILRGASSGWSAPVKVDDPVYYFVVSASERDSIGGARATAEVYRFYYGHWRRGAANVEPGDVLVAEADLPDGLVIFDLARLEKGERPPELAPPPGDLVPQPEPAPGRGVPGEETIIIPAPGSPRDPRTPAPAPAAPSTPTAPQDLVGTPVGKKVSVMLQAILLDVARTPGTARGVRDGGVQAVVRTPTGAIEVRTPETDRRSEVYQRVSSSAKDGERQVLGLFGSGSEAGPPALRPGEQPGRRDREEEEGGGGGGG